MSLQIKRLSYAQIKQYASEFLSTYHSDGSIPVPIEDIVDLKMRINIVPIPGLLHFGVNAYTWSDLKSIAIDDYFYNNQGRRYRFTLAHELGHIVLHSYILQSAQVNSIEQYLKFVNSISDDDHRWTEWQADCFAGLILVPSKPLLEKLREQEQKAKQNNLNVNDMSTRGYIADAISDHFEVSAKTIETRLVYDNLWERPQKGSR